MSAIGKGNAGGNPSRMGLAVIEDRLHLLIPDKKTVFGFGDNLSTRFDEPLVLQNKREGV